MSLTPAREGRGMPCGFEVTDCFGRRVTLDHSNAQRHLVRHAEAAPHVALLALVLQAPHVVWQDNRDGHYHYYRRGFPSVQLRAVWLRVIVVDFPTGAKVVSWWLSRQIDRRGRQRWPQRRRH